MTREEFYKLTDILNSEVLGNFMHGGEADELIAMFEEVVEHSNILEQEESVSEELETEIEKYLNALYRNWTKKDREKDADVEEMCRQTACHFTEWKKQQMIKNAIDAVVHIDAGGYPYIPQLELYDYDKDIPLAKEGDKYKVVLIKEE